MDAGYNFSPLDAFSLFSPAVPDVQARSRRRHRALAWLLAVAGAVSVALLLAALVAAGRSARAFQDVNLSGSLRYRSLWVYGATRPSAAMQPEDPRWPAQLAAMQAIRSRLRASYPQAVDATDPAWKPFGASLARTGRVDWQTANAMRAAADTLTERIAQDASDQNAASAFGLWLGLLGLLCALAASGLLLSGLRTAEQEMRQALADHQESRDLFLRSINALQEGYLVQDRDGKVLLCNRSAERLLGIPAADLLGREALRPDWDCFEESGEIFPEAEQPGRRALRTALPQESVVLGIDRPGEARVWFSVKAAPVFHAGETLPYAAVLTFADMTAEKQVQEDLQKGREFQSAMLESLQSGVVACDADGVLALFNRAAREFHGMPEEALPAEEWADHFDLYQADGVTPLPTDEIPLFRAYGGETVRNAEMVIAPKGCPHRIVLASGQAIYDNEGRKLGAVVAMHDITARRQAEDALRESEARLRYLSDAAFEGIAVSQNGVMLDANLAYVSLFGYETKDQMLGMTVTNFVMPECLPLIAEKVAAGSEDSYEVICRRRDGTPFWAHLRGRNIVWGGLPARVVAIRDISERKAMEDVLRCNEETMRAVLGSAPVILYAADLSGTITLSEGTGLAALGLAPGEAVGRSVNEFSGGDPLVLESTRRALAGETVSYDMRYGALCFHVALKPQRDPSGAVCGMIGVSFDITERARSEEQFRVLFDHSSEAHFLVGPEGIIDCNQAAEQMLRCPGKAELLAIHPRYFSPKHQPDGRLSAEKGLEMEAAARAYGCHRFEWVHTRCDGTEFPTEIVLTPVTLGGRQVMLAVWHDLSEQKQAEQQIKDYTVILEFQKSQLEETNKELEALATTDGLTGLKNRRTFGVKLAEEHARAVRYHQPLSLLLLDVDHFKDYNDAFGHPAGDAVLRGVAGALGQTARDTDLAARYGGEEFAVILPFTEEAGAQVIAERVRAAIADSPWGMRPVTVSVGVGTLSLDTPTPDALLACADAALYQSKEAGRNRVSHGNLSAPPIAEPPRASRAKRPAAAS